MVSHFAILFSRRAVLAQKSPCAGALCNPGGEEGGQGEGRAPEELIEPDAHIERQELGGDTGQQARFAARPRKVQRAASAGR